MKTVLTLALLSACGLAQAPQPPDPSNPLQPLADSIIKARHLHTEEEKAKVLADLMRVQTAAIHEELDREKHPPEPEPPAQPVARFEPPAAPTPPAPPDTSCGQSNGRRWAGMGQTAKVFYLTGLAEGLGRAGIAGLYIPYGTLTFGDLGNAVDGVYSDGFNVLIAIADAARITKMKFGGMPQSAIDAAVASARKRALACDDKAPAK